MVEQGRLEMEGVEGLMKKLQLSEEEKKSIRIDPGLGESNGDLPVQAVGKLLSERGCSRRS